MKKFIGVRAWSQSDTGSNPGSGTPWLCDLEQVHLLWDLVW